MNVLESTICRLRTSRYLVSLLVGVFVFRGIALLCVLPPFEGWDEYQHIGYILHISETGKAPRLGQAVVGPSLIQKLTAFPHPNWALKQFPEPAPLSYADFWLRRGGSSSAAVSVDYSVGLYEAQQPSLYYRLVEPIFRLAGGLNDLSRTIAALRLVNLLFAAAAVYTTLVILTKVSLNSMHAGLVGLILVLNPLFLFNATRVANDALGVFLASLVIYRVAVVKGREASVWSFLTGILLGLAVLAKPVNLALLPFLGASILIRRGNDNLGSGVVTLIVSCLSFLVVTLPYFYGNWSYFGVLVPMQEAVVNRSHGRGFFEMLHVAATYDWAPSVTALWLRDNLWRGGWSFVPIHPFLLNLYSVCLVVGLLGWVSLLSRRSPKSFAFSPHACQRSFFLCAAFTAAWGYHLIESSLAWGSPSTNPWYIAVTFPWFILLFYQGCLGWGHQRWKLWLPFIVAGSEIGAECYGLLVSMLPTYAGTNDLSVAFRRIGELQPLFLGPKLFLLSWAIAGLCLLSVVVSLVKQIRECAPIAAVNAGTCSNSGD